MPCSDHVSLVTSFLSMGCANARPTTQRPMCFRNGLGEGKAAVSIYNDSWENIFCQKSAKKHCDPYGQISESYHIGVGGRVNHLFADVTVVADSGSILVVP